MSNLKLKGPLFSGALYNILFPLYYYRRVSKIKKILLLIFDGLADEPIPALGGKTPLEVANIPNLNALAAKGVCGLSNPIPQGEYPSSEEAHMALFGYDYKKDLPGRGVLEALGSGVPVTASELVLRVDFGSVKEDLTVIDPRAGNIGSVVSFCKFLGTQTIDGFTFTVYPGIGHRGALVITGPDVSKDIAHHSTAVTDTDPHKAKVHRGGNKVLRPHQLDGSVAAHRTAEALWKYLLQTHQLLNGYVENRVRTRQGLLPANFILTRGAGFLKPVEQFEDRFGVKAACVAGFPLYKGVASYLGMDLVVAPGKTGLFDNNIGAKITTALNLFEKGYGFVFVHIKGTDAIAEEEGDYDKKQSYLEMADKHLGPLLDFKGIVCVTGDHATPCVKKDHSDAPVPVMIVGSKKTDAVTTFNEKSCLEGALGHRSGPWVTPALLREARDV